MKEQTKIPSTKVQRAARFIGTGAKLGGNYLKYVAQKAVNSETTRESLDKDNADDIYEVLSELKGSALKVAQMLSMDRNMLPAAYADKFRLAQHKAPPLSYPLVVRTFKRHFGKGPDELFETFSHSAVEAASIGQVHKASNGDKNFAVKVQYPGVADSVTSDLKLVKPVAMRIMNVRGKDLDRYLDEVRDKLIEETDYQLELRRSNQISKACAHLDNIVFPKYYNDLSCDRVLTMDWIEGTHLEDWIATNPPQELRDRNGQAMWDFYDYQIHQLRMVHADPHPGNFLVTPDNKLAVLDFGCVKEIPDEFYKYYFQLIWSDTLLDEDRFAELLSKLEFITPKDSLEMRSFLVKMIRQMGEIVGQPFNHEVFDFVDDDYFERFFAFGDEMSRNKKLRSGGTARGSQHGIYVNRTYFGLYNVLHDIRARVKTQRWNLKTKKAS